MAESTGKKRRVIKKPETVRQQAAKASEAKTSSPRRIKRGASTAAKPFKKSLIFLGKLLKPFSFLLLPFKTRLARLIGRILVKVFGINYFINSWREVRQVTWPNAKETTKLTIAVFVFAIIFSGLVAILDYGLDKIFQRLLLS